VIETARAQAAELIGEQPREITFMPRGARGTNAAIHTALTCLCEIDIIAQSALPGGVQQANQRGSLQGA
jgi:cysteine sulfinate desulfinase/cysteine desulfurase-like protein